MKTDLEDDLAAEPSLLEILDMTRENEGWDMTGGSKGERAMPIRDDEEDDEGRSNTAAMVESGVEAAEFDQMLQADKNEPQDFADENAESQRQEDSITGDDDTSPVADEDAKLLEDEVENG